MAHRKSPQPRQEAQQRGVDLIGFFLLHPVSGSFDQLAHPHVGACAPLHASERSRLLMDAPILRARNECARYIDSPARKQP